MGCGLLSKYFDMHVFDVDAVPVMASYSVESVIGSGGYGTVYGATRKFDRLEVNSIALGAYIRHVA